MPKNEKNKNQQPPFPKKRKITKDDAEHYRYPDSKTPDTHSDSAPIGGG